MKFVRLLLVFLMTCYSTGISAQLIISQYYEGASNNKWIEVANIGATSVDASALYLALFSNAAADAPATSAPNSTLLLGGTFAVGEVRIYRNSGALLPAGANITGTPTSTAVCGFNGDDLVIISTSNSTTVGVCWAARLDVVGDGSNWGADLSIYRNAGVGPNTTYTPSEWTQVTNATVDAAAAGTTERLGVHVFAAAPTCNISAITVANASACNDNGTPLDATDDFFTGDVTVTYSTPPATGTLDLTGDVIGTYSSTDLVSTTVFTGVQFPADGTPVSLTATFSADDTCTFTNATAATGVASCATTLGNVTLSVGCIDQTSIDLSWVFPALPYDGVVIFAREGATPSGPGTDNASSYTANANYSLAADLGAKGRVVYVGAGTNVTVTGLTTGTSYTFAAYTYSNPAASIWSSGTTATRTIGLNNVINPLTIPGDMSVTTNWQLPPAGCYDEILVVANEVAGIGFAPTGTYIGIANTVYAGANQVVFAATAGTTVTTTGLTNGTTYYFEIFLRKGASWSSGAEVSAVPNLVTIFEPGDFMIVAVNTNGALEDEVCFTSFKSITAGTSFEITDNGYERVNAGQWGNTEGTIRFERNALASTVPAGTTICIQGDGNAAASFDIYVDGVLDDPNWTITSINGIGTFNINSTNDQIWFLQGGAWSNPFSETHNSVYTGNVLYGWTGDGWEAAAGYASTSGSTLVPGLDCFVTDLNAIANQYKAKYTGSFTPATQREWLSRVNTPANWTGSIDNLTYAALAPNYSGASVVFDILAAAFSDGAWIGDADNNWFNCRNWSDLKVPDELTNVTVNAAAGFDCVVDATAAFSDRFGDVAECNDLAISGRTLTVQDAGDTLRVYNDVNISGTGTLDMSNGVPTGTQQGYLEVRGDWSNTVGALGFLQGEGFVLFNGTANQNISSVFEEQFEYLEFNKTSGEIVLGVNVIGGNETLNTGSLALRSGLVNANGFELRAHNPAVTGIPVFGETSYVYGGFLARKVLANGAYAFPLGTATDYQLAVLTTSATFDMTGDPDYIRVGFSAPTIDGTDFGLNNSEGLSLYNEMLNGGSWNVLGSAPTTAAGSFSLALSLRGSTNTGASNYAVFRYDNIDWELEGSNIGVPVINGTEIQAFRGNLTNLGRFGIARETGTLPVELLALTARAENGRIRLDWATLSESNSERFVVERSADQQRFEAIGEVKAAGQSSARLDYRFVDERPLGGTNYYRLRQVDLDGAFSLSNVVEAEIGGSRLGLLSLYPQPLRETLHLEVSLPATAAVEFTVYTVEGRRVLTHSETLPAGVQALDLSSAALAPGLYLYELRALGQRISGKLVKE